MLMEGFIDTQIMDRVPPADLGTGDRIVVYAGGLHKAYGIDLLVDAFVRSGGLCVVYPAKRQSKHYLQRRRRSRNDDRHRKIRHASG